jgi:hypothetical protein
MADLIFGTISGVKAVPEGAKIEIFIQTRHCPLDLIGYYGREVTVKDQVKRIEETPIEREAREQREREDARKYEAIGEMPQDKTDPMTCEYCVEGVLIESAVDGETEVTTIWTCLHPDGEPEQPADPASAWECKNFSRRAAPVVDAEDPVELCLGAQCAWFIALPDAACAWEKNEIGLAKDDEGNWLRHQGCLEEITKAFAEDGEPEEEAPRVETQPEEPPPTTKKRGKKGQVDATV